MLLHLQTYEYIQKIFSIGNGAGCSQPCSQQKVYKVKLLGATKCVIGASQPWLV